MKKSEIIKKRKSDGAPIALKSLNSRQRKKMEAEIFSKVDEKRSDIADTFWKVLNVTPLFGKRGRLKLAWNIIIHKKGL